jgi:sigma-B regulation protein RsbU (phosphoserine phosphatase)
MSKFDHFRFKNEMLFMNYVANTIGVCVVIFITYRSISHQLADALDMVARIGWLFDPLCFALMFVLTVRYESPIRQYLNAHRRGEKPTAELTLKARQRLLNEPFFLIGMDLIVWMTAGVIYSLTLLNSDVEHRTVYYIFFRSLQIGLITTVAAFFLLRSVLQRKMVTRLFPCGGLYTTPGTLRIRLSTRLAALLLACNLVPFFAIITIVQGTSVTDIVSENFYENLKSDLLVSCLTFMAIGILLTYQLSHNLRHPFGDIIRVLKAVRNGDFDQEVQVTSNDEIGYTGDVINEMTDGLRERNRMRHSLELAQEVQQNFMPQTSPLISGLDIAGQSIFCERTGGDYFDYIQLPKSKDHKIGIVIGDVSGHGISSALLMASVRSSLRQRVLLPGSIGQIMSDVNKQLTVDVEGSGRFMTLFYGEVDAVKRTFRWVRAGHDPAIFFDPQTSTFEELRGSGVALGVDENWVYTENVKQDLSINQIIVVCTDGVWEARNASGDMFGKDALYEIIRKNSGLAAGGIVEAVIAALRRFRDSAKPEDDVTVVAAKISS